MINELFELYLKEKRILEGKSELTIKSYRQAFGRYIKAVSSNELPTEALLKQYVIRMVESGLSAVSCNISIRSFNAFLSWLKENKQIEPLKIKQLKTEKKVIHSYTDDEISRILHWKPKDFHEWRTYALICTLVDTGLRIDEALGLKRARVDFNNFLITIVGKGNKERIVPFSPELRRTLYNYDKKNKYSDLWFFPTKSGNKMIYHNFLKEWHSLCQKLDLPKRGFHQLRHNFGLNFIREGGDISELRRLLGHSSIQTTQIYINLQTEDLKRAHAKTSILSRLK
jgi:site-specific recombinase XerD